MFCLVIQEQSGSSRNHSPSRGYDGAPPIVTASRKILRIDLDPAASRPKMEIDVEMSASPKFLLVRVIRAEWCTLAAKEATLAQRAGKQTFNLLQMYNSINIC